MAGTERRAGVIGYAALYLAAWAAATAYLYAKGADWTFPIVSLGVFGIALGGLGFFLTRGANPPPVPVRRPRPELIAVLLYLTAYCAFLVWGLGALKAAFPPGQTQEMVVLAAKLLVHVVLPAGLLLAMGAKVGPLFDLGLGRKGFWRTLIVLGAIFVGLLAVVSPSLKQAAALHPPVTTLLWALPASYLWISIEAGLCEEFLFRAVLQSRLAAVLNSTAGAIAIGAILFSLAHVPGLYLRGGPGVDGWSTDLLQVMAFTVATLSPLAVMFGVLWARTRSLLLVALLHGAVDVLPHLGEFLKIWAGLS